MPAIREVIEDLKSFGEESGLYDKRILLLFSGGKDSSLALYLLKKARFDVAALTFKHRWSWREPLLWALNFTKELGVTHYIVDTTEGLLRDVIGRKGNKMCMKCKKRMLFNAYYFAKLNGFDVLAKGDNSNDKIIGALLDQWKGDIRLSGIPKIGIPFFRPLIKYTANDVEELAKEAKIEPLRMYEHGRRRQWREGCPLQYLDYESVITEKSMDLAYELNFEISKLARKHKVRMSVLVPTFKIMCHSCNEEILEEAMRIIKEATKR
ncbi:hypothetical protein PAP_07205 [Palaeococcus pacificus DY20341]|uniref:tRNA(Ile)-lysidine/2-thiocytidine synthase N-terminal domain-containing protein n=1 Tax=Palaeococcus pacificus DY20341 TaxID=1343739 RepID=A0A075LUL5_9EURY|nr:ATP-binding protein [Palaeococcus pacificus]AIF69831.1 hypothetical protein PAP_07205 [Palaeococcus pacificus DY20341]